MNYRHVPLWIWTFKENIGINRLQRATESHSVSWLQCSVVHYRLVLEAYLSRQHWHHRAQAPHSGEPILVHRLLTSPFASKGQLSPKKALMRGQHDPISRDSAIAKSTKLGTGCERQIKQEQWLPSTRKLKRLLSLSGMQR